MSYDLSDYVEVSERIEQFYATHPHGSLQGEGEFVRDEQGRIFGYVYRAQAFRSSEDTCPGVGTAFEPIPGKTQFTRDSEVMNAETSAWGRAIVACGFPSKHIASANEVRARQDAGGRQTGTGEPPPATGSGTSTQTTATASAPENPASQAQAAYEANRSVPGDDGKPENVEITFGKHKGLTLGQVPDGYLKWLIENFEARNPEQRRVLEAAHMMVGAPAGASADPIDDIPFAPVPV